MFPGNMMIPRMIDFSSRIPRSLCGHIGSDEQVEGVCVDELPHSFDADTFLFRKEYKNLVGWILSGVCEEIELVSTGPRESNSAGAHFYIKSDVLNAASTICVVLPECDQVHVDLLVRDLVSLHSDLSKLHQYRKDHDLAPYPLQVRGLSD
jgi:hypothetical protein